MQALEILTFTIAAGETKRYELAGRYFEILQSVAPLDVRLTDPAGNPAARLIAADAGTWAQVTYSGFEVKNVSDLPQLVRLFVTDATAGSRRTPGLVEVLDTDTARTLAGAAYFLSYTQTGGATAAALALVNPATAQKLLVVSGFTLAVTAAGIMVVSQTETQANDLAGGTVGMSNLRLDGAAPANAVCRRGNLPGLWSYQNIIAQLDTSTSYTLPQDVSIVIPPGYALAFRGLQAAANLTATLTFSERAP